MMQPMLCPLAIIFRMLVCIIVVVIPLLLLLTESGHVSMISETLYYTDDEIAYYVNRSECGQFEKNIFHKSNFIFVLIIVVSELLSSSAFKFKIINCLSTALKQPKSIFHNPNVRQCLFFECRCTHAQVHLQSSNGLIVYGNFG